MASIAERRAGILRSRSLSWLAVAALGFAAPLLAQTRGFIPVNPPGAGTLADQGTVAIAINQSGVVAGYYGDDNHAFHGFVRSAQGVITEFDAPGLTNTMVFGINSSGQVVGNGHHQFNIRGELLGFLRNSNGAFSGISPSGAVTTFPNGINDSGEIAGFYYTGRNDVDHGFIAANSGAAFSYTRFDEPDASLQPSGGTVANGINASGEVFGYYTDATVGAVHGFTRDREGNFTSFDAPGAGRLQGYGTIPLSINGSGEIVGYYSDSVAVFHGFYRDALGNVTDFDPPGSVQTFAYGINDHGDVVGYWMPSFQGTRGFLRDKSGNITSFSAPVQDASATLIFSINNARQMTGSYYDLNGALHGFLWQAASAEDRK